MMFWPHLRGWGLTVLHEFTWRAKAWIDLWRWLEARWQLRPSQSAATPSLLIIKVDEIGDYILFRDALAAVTAHYHAQGYQIEVLLNAAVAPFAEADTYPAHKLYLQKSQWKQRAYRYSWLKKLRNAGYTQVFNAHYSRNAGLDDLLAMATGAPAIAWTGNDSNSPFWVQTFTNAYYKALLSGRQAVCFEYTRNQEWAALLAPACIPSPLPPPAQAAVTASPGTYGLLFPGAGRYYRRWPARYFIQLLDKLRNTHPELPVLIAGGPADEAICAEIAGGTRHPQVRNLCGQTDLRQLSGLIARARFLVTNETGAFHLAAAHGTPAVVLSNGNHYGRFAPYPDHFPQAAHMRYCFPTELYPDLATPEGQVVLAHRFRRRSRLPMEEIPVEAVENALYSLPV
ncbi:MAG: glycosyltransferase family 9 protein [Bacteroidetes bacterium]|nr:glycosyltransferase family 9 protein [Bacteroidota bacterium]